MWHITHSKRNLAPPEKPEIRRWAVHFVVCSVVLIKKKKLDDRGWLQRTHHSRTDLYANRVTMNISDDLLLPSRKSTINYISVNFRTSVPPWPISSVASAYIWWYRSSVRHHFVHFPLHFHKRRVALSRWLANGSDLDRRNGKYYVWRKCQSNDGVRLLRFADGISCGSSLAST